MKPRKTSALEMGEPINLPRFLAYALPRAPHDTEAKFKATEGFVLHDVPLGAAVSFLDFDGIVLFAGAFEKVGRPDVMGAHVVCVASSDLDLREREFFSAIQHGKTVIFLLPQLPQKVGYYEVDPRCDLVRRIAQKFGLQWSSLSEPSPLVESLVPEFREYVNRYGTGYVEFAFDKDGEDLIKPLCGSSQQVFGVAVAGKIFLVPSPVPQTQEQLDKIVQSVILATITYRKRMSTQIPVWINQFVFARESELHGQLENIQKKALELEGEIGNYADLKGALCYQSEPLVKVVTTILGKFFGIKLVVDEKYIEDATLRDENEAVLAVFEIKGVKGNFTRNNVNQVDSHRERLVLPPTTPGVLIMNTMMAADSLTAKDEQPHPDIIKKAVAENVLLVRTLDLLRFADGVERGVLNAGDLRTQFLTQAGWLRVVDDKAEVVKD